MERPMTAHHFTIDLEEYFQVSAFESRVARSEWERFESRVAGQTHQRFESLSGAASEWRLRQSQRTVGPALARATRRAARGDSPDNTPLGRAATARSGRSVLAAAPVRHRPDGAPPVRAPRGTRHILHPH